MAVTLPVVDWHDGAVEGNFVEAGPAQSFELGIDVLSRNDAQWRPAVLSVSAIQTRVRCWPLAVARKANAGNQEAGGCKFPPSPSQTASSTMKKPILASNIERVFGKLVQDGL